MDSKVLTRRGLLRASVVAGAGLALTACQPKVVEKEVVKEVTKVVEKQVEKVVQQTVVVEKQVEKVVQQTVIVQKVAPKGKPSIRYTTDWYGGVRGNLTNQFLAQWKDKVRPDVNIAYEPCPRVQDRLRVDFAAGTPSDVMLFSPNLYMDFADQLLVLDDFWATADKAWKDDVLGISGYFYLDGKLIGVPFQHNIWGPAINIDLFKKAGLRMPWEHNHSGDKWWDWNDFLEAAKAIRALGADYYGYDVGGRATYMEWGPWVLTNGGNWVNPPWPKRGQATASTLNQPQTVEAIKFVTDLMCTHKVAIPLDLSKQMETTLQVSPFYAGRIGIAQMINEASVLKAKINGHRVVMPRSPKTKYARQNQSNAPHVAYKGTQFPKECWDFMVFLDSKWAQRESGIQGGSMPGLRSILGDPDYYKDFPAIAKEALLTSAAENDALPNAFANFEEWRKDVEAIATDMFLCKLPADQAIPQMHTAAERVLAKRAG